MNRVLDRRTRMSVLALLTMAWPLTKSTCAAPPQSKSESFNARARLTRVIYNGHAAFRLSDGRTEAIVVPEISRLMAYRFVGGKNVLWNNPSKDPTMFGWKNWGGDKNWFAPQTWWPATNGGGWPPAKTWDDAPFQAEVLSNARLRTTSPVAQGTGARIIREYSMNALGELEIKQIAEKVSGAPLMLSIWSISQMQPDAVYLPLNPKSVYKNNFFWFDNKPAKGARVQAVAPSLLRVMPSQPQKIPGAVGYKIGMDARVAAFVMVKGDVAFMEKSNFGEGPYPDGTEGGGCPVELYESAIKDESKHYVELELLSPLRLMNKGSRWQSTLKWSLTKLQSSDPNAAATHREIVRLMPAAAP